MGQGGDVVFGGHDPLEGRTGFERLDGGVHLALVRVFDLDGDVEHGRMDVTVLVDAASKADEMWKMSARHVGSVINWADDSRELIRQDDRIRMSQGPIDQIRQDDKGQALFLSHELFQPSDGQQLGRVVPILRSYGFDELPDVAQYLCTRAFYHTYEFGEGGEDLESIGVLIQVEDHADFDGLIAPTFDFESVLPRLSLTRPVVELDDVAFLVILWISVPEFDNHRADHVGEFTLDELVYPLIVCLRISTSRVRERVVLFNLEIGGLDSHRAHVLRP